MKKILVNGVVVFILILSLFYVVFISISKYGQYSEKLNRQKLLNEKTNTSNLMSDSTTTKIKK